MRLGVSVLALALGAVCLPAQVIEFESNGLKYQTLTRSGVTIMFAAMPEHLHEFAIIQVAVSNGSAGPYVIRPEDFTYVRIDGTALRASPARNVIAMLEQKGSAGDVIKLVNSYEKAIYGNQRLRSTNGYEQRRQAAIAMGSTKLKAAATASALAMVQSKLAAGESTDGAVFFITEGKPLGPGRLVVRTNTDVFDFRTD
ncbi:MAG TPA: hypothetical protein VMS37_34155 [Verrucomicrobiae bacterium]|nr:hypothetical protein [Verrucomicrobiae bacterium]